MRHIKSGMSGMAEVAPTPRSLAKGGANQFTVGWFYAAAAILSRTIAALPASLTPKNTTGEFVGSRPL